MSKFFLFQSDNGIYEKLYTTLINGSIKLSHRILFNCTSITNSFLAVGCNTGNIYVFNIENNKFKYYLNIISNDSAVNYLQFSPSNNYLVYNNIKFQIFIYKLNLSNETGQLIRQIDSIQNSLVHSFLWDDDCSRIFCGFKSGVVDVVYVPLQAKDIFHIPSETILKLEKQSIIQMDFIKDALIVSTNEKVILVNLQTKFSVPIGTKPRSGAYGACFWFGEAKNLKVIAARPNYRLWIAAIDGTVEETHQYKNWINSSKYKIREADENIQGTGQFSWLYPIRNNLIFAGDSGGLILIIDLVLKSCLISIDCGANITKSIYSNHGVMILSSQRDIINISVSSIKDAIIDIINEGNNVKHAIDLFLSLSCEFETNQSIEYKIDIERICSSFAPSLLTLIVEKAAELDYRFLETNKLQVIIRDNEEYHKLYYSIKTDDVPRTSNSNSTDATGESLNEVSIESDNSSSNVSRSSKMKKTASDKIKNMVRPQILQTIYDKTSKLLMQMDVIGSSGSDPHLNILDSFSKRDSQDDSNQDTAVTFKQSFVQPQHGNAAAYLNLMELEANVYIARERLKQLTTTEDVEKTKYFIESLSNFCESWLSLNLQYWQNLFFNELDIRNLSASLPNFILQSIAGLENSNESSDSFIPHDEKNYLYSNSWSSTISRSEWIKQLPLPDKITNMLSMLLSHCFSYRIFPLFPDLLNKIYDVSNFEQSQHSISETVKSVECTNDTTDKSLQVSIGNGQIKFTNYKTCYRFPYLLEMLNDKLWPVELDLLWIRSMISLFHSVINPRDIRNWIGSCISQNVWLTIFECYTEVFSSTLGKEEYQSLSTKSKLELDKLLFNSLCIYSIESLVVSDVIFTSFMQNGGVNWKIVVESENLHCRDVLHLSIKHDIDLTNYIIFLFNNINVSSRFNSRQQLIDHIYSQPDVLVSFIYTLLNNKLSADVKHKTCSCGLILVYSELDLPENIYSIVIDILKWVSDQNVIKTDITLMELLTTICVDMGFHQGCVELLVALSDIKKLVQIGIQTSNIRTLERIKDCNIVSSQSLKQAIELLITLRRKQTKNRCLGCNASIEDRYSILPLSWQDDLGELIFNKLMKKLDNEEIHHSVIKMLRSDEIQQIKKFLVTSINNVMNSRKIVVKNQMFNFITTEMNQVDDSAKLTEMYLNIYAMTHSELCGSNWGKILSQNMHCDICGSILIGKTSTSEKRDIVSFSCSHTFHRKCLENIGCEKICFMC